MTKTILIITDNLPEQINGVVTTYTNIEACAVLDGYHVVYLTPGDFRYFDCPKYNEVKIALTRQMGNKIKEIGADYYHIATEGPLGLSARKYFSKHHISYSTAYHSKFPEGLKKLFGIPERFTWGFVRWFHKKASVVLTTTDTMVDELKAHGFRGNIIPWTRGVDRSIFNPSQRTGTVTNGPILVCVSRVSKEKNLEAYFEMPYAGVKFMVGDGPMLEEYKANYPDVKFVGAKRGQELAKYFAMADVFVFPSRWETFGLVMIEAMACGTPVAAYPCQGPLDVVDEGVTGCMREDLQQAVHDALKLDRAKVLAGSQRWTWERAWQIFRDNLVSVKSL
jgi:glycosyltransferase involved in cell wall biosynthesis